ncbi:NAD(P)-dependent dehydrogenase (short-subunit alcohol dehydrogenase family) [Scopulibacillus darangshiensis]|uniref:NAD(P)-dependent dehydrogenase (Short-subunit alcohol dehydrogenase family) n=1 Tax=Scopulibacillus darangshiensis TaxID=442528 RepID=A0A4R2NT20_9BACL|nr:SDR family oxidoreductase [Scopulibacillus darangshiensis]TCP24942.1 NAD(P)-dependent dehydrogenase (short-subunit alcohol dehydrogenase family) [Scopulibacillus darangshiensis]
MKPLEGKIALVTGASRGIGRAIAFRLAGDGALVAVHYAKNEEAAKQTIHDIASIGGKAFGIQAEFGLSMNMDAFFADLDSKVEKYTGQSQFDILVNNAGIAQMGTIEEISEEAFDKVMAVNLKTPFFLVQQALQRLRDGGRIINISSLAAQNHFPGTIAYNLSKAGLNTLTQTLAKQLGSRSITVNALMPGVVETEVNAELLKRPESKKRAAQSSVFDRLGQVEDIADVAAFFASPDSRWVTGQLVDASGGGGL